MAHWLWMRYGISDWKAWRWIAAAHALTDLPRISQAFTSGELGLDKVVELTRFATPDSESDLICWARGVSCGAVRRKGDLAARAGLEEVVDADRDRSLSRWYFDEGRRFGLEAELPAAQGSVIAKALERLAETLPVMPGEEEPLHASARRADALVALCSARIASDPDQDRATVVVHAQLDGLETRVGGGRGRGRARDPSRDPQALALQRPGPDRGGGSVGCRDRARAAHSGTGALDHPPGALSRQRMPVPGLRRAKVHIGPPHRVLA